MKITLTVLGYLKWHYGRAIISLTKIWGNFCRFVFNFFSIKLLFKNFFDPWKRMSDSYPKNFNLKTYFVTWTVNLITRLVGMIMRLALLIIGLLACLFTGLLFPVTIAVWLLLPLVVIFLLGDGLYLLITK